MIRWIRPALCPLRQSRPVDHPVPFHAREDHVERRGRNYTRLSDELREVFEELPNCARFARSYILSADVSLCWISFKPALYQQMCGGVARYNKVKVWMMLICASVECALQLAKRISFTRSVRRMASVVD